MEHSSLPALAFLAMILTGVAVPALLGSRRGGLSKWTAIALSTLLSPFLMLGSLKMVALIYWSFYRDQMGGGCPGGECGGDAIAAGYWPLLIVMFFPPAFFVSWIVVALIRSGRS